MTKSNNTISIREAYFNAIAQGQDTTELKQLLKESRKNDIIKYNHIINVIENLHENFLSIGDTLSIKFTTNYNYDSINASDNDIIYSIAYNNFSCKYLANNIIILSNMDNIIYTITTVDMLHNNDNFIDKVIHYLR